MANYDELISNLSSSDVLIYAAVDKKDPTLRTVTYRNKAGVSGNLTSKQMYMLGVSPRHLPVIKKARDVAMALRSDFPRFFQWNYFDLVGNNSASVSDDALNDMREELLADVAAQLTSVFKYKGTVENLANLPNSNNLVGDVYQVKQENYSEYCWIVADDNGHWEYLGKNIDLSSYLQKSVYDAFAGDISQRVNNLELLSRYAYQNVFVSSASTLTLSVNTRYFVKANLTAILPDSAENNDEIKIVLMNGGEASTVSVPENFTINGSADPVALNASIDQSTFVLDVNSNDWVMF